jgi:endonuclease/exonuclease/phosphatase family metal-dependent hydrolase
MRGILFIVLLSFSVMGMKAQSSEYRMMTYNIRYDNPNDGRHQWGNRKDKVVSVISYFEPDVMGVQEALLHQIEELNEQLPEYEWVGVGRDDGRQKGEFSPVFFRTDRFELVDQGTFWLSETPEIPGKMGWDAACARVATWARLRDRGNGRDLVVVNTHFDHRGEKARLESSRLLKKRCPEIAGDLPYVLMGDFNCRPDSAPLLELSQIMFLSSEVNQGPSLGPVGTFNGFQPQPEGSQAIDHIFVSKAWEVNRHAVLAVSWNGDWSSDHHPVLIHARWNP